MARVEDISWGSYQEFEGPFYRGKTKFELPPKPSIVDKQMAVITAIESGHYDAINMYDRMIITVGLIQWGEANTFAVSKMLGYVCESGLESVVQMHLKPALEASGASFKITAKGNWRFFIGNSEVNSVALQQKLFLGCDGRKGSWTDQSKRHAKLWAACVASVLEDPHTRDIQRKYTGSRLMGFVAAEAKKALFDDKSTSPWAEATRTIYLTYAINLPRIAGEMFAATKFVGEKWSPEWCTCLIKKLTFGPNVKIYPIRYNAMRPVVERLYGIELPKSAADLQTWVPPTLPLQPQPAMKPDSTSQVTIDQKVLNELNQIVSKSNPRPPAVNLVDAVMNFFKKLFTR